MPGSGAKRSKHELKRLVESAVAEECHLAGRSLWFCVDEVEASGQPPSRIRIWATLHFLAGGPPFCCGEPDCQLGTFLPERRQRIGEHICRAMGLEQDVTIEFANRFGVHYHEGVQFQYRSVTLPPQTASPAWIELTHAEQDEVWDRFYEQFKFRPSVRESDWPGIQEPTPSTTFDISSVYGPRASELESDLTYRMLAAFRHCISPPGRMYALDWQHPGYWFDPHGVFDAADPDRWNVPVLPNGDYYIFLAEDFSFGVFGHPWEQTMCVFGKSLLEAVEASKPKLFSSVVRRHRLAT